MLHAIVAAFLYTFEKLTANDIYIKGEFVIDRSVFGSNRRHLSKTCGYFSLYTLHKTHKKNAFVVHFVRDMETSPSILNPL
jgi:hypothetical protein